MSRLNVLLTLSSLDVLLSRLSASPSPLRSCCSRIIFYDFPEDKKD